MSKVFIQLTYRQIIDASAQTDFEKNVLHFSFEEYKMKSQAYNADGSIKTFTALKTKDGRANSLHYKAGFVIGGIVEQLQNKIPFLQDALGKAIEFDTHQFEVIESDTTNIHMHKVAIHYTTKRFIWLQTIGESLLLSQEYDGEDVAIKRVETFMLKMQEGLSITNYQSFPVFNMA